MHQGLGSMSNSEIDARNIHGHLVKSSRWSAAGAILFSVSLGVVAVLYLQQQSNPEATHKIFDPATDPVFMFQIMLVFYCVMVLILTVRAIQLSGLARKIQAMLDKQQFAEIEREFHKYRPRRRG
ncbi:hypothetical protein [Deinococcus cellulosilyticus]|uniref:Uncharacterized protein n=1 Tax=Deinococcus cellulosilyticus (strain DSM 18568 / NBRC 106333 / KACC 11606 / 5516J-15) TaxID=1223518 RepID=A0A511N868_DEIC1|nr:hypothetical protein [Deinococcus cellulosilyticus]GEM49032.1 hypothetical protein DC3_46670 [Deinococcus cellulosilyticus NBRC 106333 = KACC 11606]